jgi:succinate dehydrogenase / fumarate reductase flavoprotein subunit
LVRVIDTDVLVIGSGIAGSTTAIEVNRRGANVVIIDKTLLTKGGSSRVGRRFGAWIPPEEVPFRLPIASGAWTAMSLRYFYDLELADNLTKISTTTGPDSNWGMILWIESLGGYFRRHPDGTMWPEPFIGSHAPKADVVGKMILDTLGPEIRRRNITVLEEHMATRLLTRDGEVIGATALDVINGELVAIRAKATVLATGTTSTYSNSSVPDTLSGDGYAIALKAGAELIDQCEIVWYDYGPVNLPDKEWPKNWRFSIGAWTLRPIGIGPTFVDSKGEVIATKHRHLFPSIDRPSGVADWTGATARIAQANAIEMAEGHGNIRVDYTRIPNVNSWMKRLWWRYDYLEKIGIDPQKDTIPIGTIPHTTTGGIRITSTAQVYGVPGLYAVGGVSALGTGMPLCVASGWWAGEAGAERARSMEAPALDWSQVQEEEDKINGILAKTREKMPDGVLPSAVKKKLKDVMWEKCGFFKNEKDLTELLNELRRIREEEAPKMCLESDSRAFNTGLVEYLEVENLLLCDEVFVESAIRKKETRGTFVRTDYPKPGPRRHTIAKMVDGKLDYRYFSAPPEVLKGIADRERALGLPPGF